MGGNVARTCENCYSVLLTRGTRGAPVRFRVGRKTLWTTIVTGMASFAALGYGAAQHYLSSTDPMIHKSDLRAGYEKRLNRFKAERNELRQDVRQLKETRKSFRSALSSLGRQVGVMQARMARVDALGKRVVETAGLEGDEFDFSKQPGLGGPDAGAASTAPDLTELAREVEKLSARMSDRRDKLELLRGMIDRRSLRREMRPDGWPTLGEGAWLSSDFGKRIDPISGNRVFHYGVDIANHLGSEVQALAPGVVTWAGERQGYGKLVEVDHGNGYRTRYGHNKEVEVDVGDRVTEDTLIGKVGNTGRSTGPHIHLEVLHNGKQINPAKFLDQ